MDTIIVDVSLKVYPKSICFHPDERLPEYMRLKAISALVMQPAKRKMQGTLGNPCQNEFKEYTF
ncbi:MAG: hypothetical protein GTO23_02405 [Nitrososphaeria archaeon]|nr:hypothetical protein [Nitrososphaeria archaeon]